MSGGKGEKENMFYITGVLITGFSPEKPELRHEKALVLSPCFLSLIAILFSFLLGMFFLDFFLSLPKVYHIPVCSSFDLIFLRISFFPWEKIEFNAIQLPDFFYYSLSLSLSLSFSLSLSLSYLCQMILEDVTKNKKGRKRKFLQNKRCFPLIVHKSALPNLNLESFSWNAKNDICFSLQVWSQTLKD